MRGERRLGAGMGAVSVVALVCAGCSGSASAASLVGSMARSAGRSAALLGGARDDILRAGRPDGGAGDDLIHSRNGRPDVVRCGAGTDRVWADPGDRLVGCDRTLRSRPRALR